MSRRGDTHGARFGLFAINSAMMNPCRSEQPSVVPNNWCRAKFPLPASLHASQLACMMVLIKGGLYIVLYSLLQHPLHSPLIAKGEFFRVSIQNTEVKKRRRIIEDVDGAQRIASVFSYLFLNACGILLLLLVNDGAAGLLSDSARETIELEETECDLKIVTSSASMSVGTTKCRVPNI